VVVFCRIVSFIASEPAKFYVVGNPAVEVHMVYSRLFCSCCLWLPGIADADIIFLPCDFYLSSSSLFFFVLAESQRSAIGCLPYFHTWCGLSANLECMSEICTQFAKNTGCKKLPSWHHRTTLSGHIFASKACIDNRTKTCKTPMPSPHVLIIW